jgi:hypothetical protein
MSKITYLFGAGASRHALPIVTEIPSRIKNLIDFLSEEGFILDSNAFFQDLNLPKSRRELQIEMIDSLKWMMDASHNHASIDTFAKKLFIKRNDKELKRLRIAMSIFFIFEQARNKPDFRYDAFFASLFNDLNSFPDHIRILSWNYDYQFELAFSEYTDQHDISTNQSWLRVKTKLSRSYLDKGFGIYKLNGTTGLADHTDRHYPYTSNLKTGADINLINQITRNYAAATYLPNIYSTLSFAWENDYQNYGIVDAVVDNTKDCEALVIVGYSFPFFNRDIDKKIINAMASLKKVYVQAPDANDLIERFQALRDNLTGIELLPKYDVGQFLLPNEL